jgi:hypothetical protein
VKKHCYPGNAFCIRRPDSKFTLVHKRKAGEIFTGDLLCCRDSSGNGTHPTLYIKGMGLLVRIDESGSLPGKVLPLHLPYYCKNFSICKTGPNQQKFA